MSDKGGLYACRNCGTVKYDEDDNRPGDCHACEGSSMKKIITAMVD